MRYFKARLTEKTHALIYRIYVSDCLYATQNNSKISKRYYDIYDRMIHPPKEETRTSEEIVTHIRDKIKELSHE